MSLSCFKVVMDEEIDFQHNPSFPSKMLKVLDDPILIPRTSSFIDHQHEPSQDLHRWGQLC